MGIANDNILTINTGSSSIKLDLFSVDYANEIFERTIDVSIAGIGLSNSVMTVHQSAAEDQTSELTIADHAAAIDVLIQWLADRLPTQTITAIGYRVVHGGPDYFDPELITDDFEQKLASLVSLDPEHAPASLRLIRAMRQQFPNIPHIACFDTAFFHDLPRLAQILPLPRRYQTQGLRRYGFHGLSYTYLSSAFRTIAGDTAANGRVIFAHLGSGASLAATRGGLPVDTTMSFTPASGIMMSSRSGDIDPGIAGYLHQQTGMSLEDFDHMVNFESGLLGVSELSGDMYSLLEHEATDPRAAEAINLFVYQVKKSIGALSAALGGLDSLIFSGGIGERSHLIRGRVVEGLNYLGIELAETANQQQAELISAPTSQVGVHVIATDEAQVIAKQVIKSLDGKQARAQL